MVVQEKEKEAGNDRMSAYFEQKSANLPLSVSHDQTLGRVITAN